MAMLRAAHFAGDPRLGGEAVELLRRKALGAPLPDDAAHRVRSMRRRLEESVAGRDHVKRGWGGYVDVEFIAQYHCLGLDPAQVPTVASTVACLARLGEIGRIPAAAASELIRDLQTLRFIEGRMRLWVGKAVSSLPTDDLARGRLATRCHFADRAAFDLALHLARERSRRWFEKLV